MSYSCELWGFCEANQLERLHLGFLKSILCVRKTTPTAFVYKETNSSPLINGRLKRILNYWLKIITLNDSNPVKIIYKLLLKDTQDNANITNWVSLLRNMLMTRGFGDIWLQQYVPDNNNFVSLFTQRVSDIFMQQNTENIYNVSEHRLYKQFLNTTISTEYLHTIKEKYIRVAITRFRLGSHNFMVERGRWQRPKLDFINRKCDLCLIVEDEYHISIECPRFETLRIRYLPRYLLVRPNMFKFINFINNVEGRNLKLFGIFCHKVLTDYCNNIA